MWKWRIRIRKRLSFVAIGVMLVGLGMNIVLAFAPNIISHSISGTLVFVGIGLTIIGIILLGISLFRALPEESSITPKAYQEIGMACHLWKLDWQLYPEHREGAQNGGKYLDVWDWMKTKEHPYSVENWLKYRPLFDEPITKVNNKLSEIIRLFPNSIDEHFKMEVYSAIRQLKSERDFYLGTINLISILNLTDMRRMLDARFDGVIDCLAKLSRKADKIYEEKI